MTVTLDLGPELETELRDEAARQGMDPDGFILDTLRDRVRRNRRDVPSFPQTETELLLQISAGLPEGTWRRYHALVARRRAETLAPEEHAELIRLSSQVEEDNARRIGCVAELAKSWGKTLDETWHQMQSVAYKPSNI